jgi:hypothetical protein
MTGTKRFAQIVQIRKKDERPENLIGQSPKQVLRVLPRSRPRTVFVAFRRPDLAP